MKVDYRKDPRKPDRKDEDTPKYRSDRRIADEQFDEVHLLAVVCDRCHAGDRGKDFHDAVDELQQP